MCVVIDLFCEVCCASVCFVVFVLGCLLCVCARGVLCLVVGVLVWVVL